MLCSEKWESEEEGYDVESVNGQWKKRPVPTEVCGTKRNDETEQNVECVPGSRHRDQNIIVSPTKPRVWWSQLRSNLASFSFMSLWIVGGPRAATQATHTRPVKWRNKILIFSPPTRFSRHLYFIWRELKGFSLRWQDWKVSWFQMTRLV